MPQTRIGFCPDTAHLAAGGGDPAELIRQATGSAPTTDAYLAHLKSRYL